MNSDAGQAKDDMRKLTPVLFVESIEPCLDFWITRLGFQKTVEIKEGDSLGFVILTKDNVEIMYQSRASLAKDVPSLADGPFQSSTLLYIQVSNVDDIVKSMEGIKPVVAKRTTFYGATEVFYREPGGYVVAFATHVSE